MRFDLSDLDAAPEQIPFESVPREMLEVDGEIWVATADGLVHRIDLEDNQPDVVADIGADPRDVVFTAGHVWFSLLNQGVVVRLDPAAPEVPLPIPVSFATQPDAVVGNGSEVWVAMIDQSTIIRVTPTDD